MEPQALKNVKIGKKLLIALVILSIGASCLDCVQGSAVTLNGLNGLPSEVTYTRNNFSLFAVALAAVQIFLIWKNRFGLQMIPAVVNSANMILMPFVLELQNKLSDLIVYIQAPTGESAVRQWELTPWGYIYVVLGWLLLASSALVAWYLPKQKAILTENPEERDEGIR